MSTRVLHVIARMNVGGTARYVGDLVEKIPDSKLATGSVQGSEIEDDCLQKLTVLRVPHMGRKISPINDFRSWIEVKKIIKEVQPTIVHTHTFKAGLIGRLIRGQHKRVHTFHGHLFDDQSFSLIERKIIIVAEKFLAKRTDLLISVGKKVGIEIRAQRIGVNQSWLSIAPGVKALPAAEKQHARGILGLRDTGVLVGWMARMTAVKNPSALLKIAKQLPDFNFVMAGGGDLLEKIKSQAPPNVSVIGWADASTFWSAVDCAISTSDNEGMPIALIEAQLAGLPVVATDAGSNSEVIENNKTGIISTKNIIDLSLALKSIFADPTRFSAMGAAAKQRGITEFGLDQMLEKHRRAYDSLTLTNNSLN